MPTMSKYPECLLDLNMALCWIILYLRWNSAICIAYNLSTLSRPGSKYLPFCALENDSYGVILIIDGCLS